MLLGERNDQIYVLDSGTIMEDEVERRGIILKVTAVVNSWVRKWSKADSEHAKRRWR